MIKILGISSFYHDSAAALIEGGKIIAAAQEERFTRIKHDERFPVNAIKYVLNEGNITIDMLSYIVFYEKPFIKFERLLETYVAYAPHGFKNFSTSMPIWIKDKLFQKRNIISELKQLSDKKINWENKILFSEHHLSHAASAFYASPFDEAAILTMDGVGEWTTTSFALGSGNKIVIEKEIHFPHSLGLLYSSFTYYTGFKVNSGEYKVMGLAPYGESKYLKKIKDNLIDVKNDGSFRLNMSFFNYCTGLTMTNNKFNNLFGGPPRKPESKLTQKEMDLAASIQKITEEVVIKLAKNIAKETSQKNLCLAGGVALNCVANGALVKEKIFDNIWIQPALGDAGGALGAALGVYYNMLGKPRYKSKGKDLMQGSYLGPSFKRNEIKKTLNLISANFEEYNDNEIINRTAKFLSEGKTIGWMNGRMEFGPRALGARSIIADPRSPEIQKLLNLKIKFRESFRPFAPSVLKEDLQDWFDINIDSPYMLLVANIKNDKKREMNKNENQLFGIDKLNIPRSEIPAVTHVDYSARIQTVDREDNPKYYALIKRFKELTGCSVIINTSFNIRGEPIICNPLDAFKCFMGTELDILVIENFILEKDKQNMSLKEDYKDKYILD